MIISALERIQQSSAEKIIIAVVNSFSLLLSIAPHFIKLYRAKGASDIYKIVCRCQSAMPPNQIFSFRVFLRFDCALISADHVSVCSFFYLFTRSRRRRSRVDYDSASQRAELGLSEMRNDKKTESYKTARQGAS